MKIKVNYYHYFRDITTHYTIDKVTNLVVDELIKKNNFFYTLKGDLYTIENIGKNYIRKRKPINDSMFLLRDCILEIPDETTHVSLTKEDNAYQMLYKYDEEKDELCYYSSFGLWTGSISYHDIPKGSKRRKDFIEKLVKIEDIVYKEE